MPRKSAKESAYWPSLDYAILDNVTLTDDDLEWLGAARQLTFWCVSSSEYNSVR